jgi:hypothetical protein
MRAAAIARDARGISPMNLHGLSLFFALCCGHALADFPLQGDFIARGKNRHAPLLNVPVGQMPQAVWTHCLTAHALIHAGTVWLITGSVIFGLIELVAHWCIDFAKCENWTGIHSDQAMHYVCKAAYALPLTFWVLR